MVELVSLKKTSIGYPAGSRQVAGPMDVSIAAGSLICLIGPNGSGKSTLLKSIAGQLPLLEGTILINGLELSQLSPRQKAKAMAFVLTRYPIVHGMSGFECVALGRTPHLGWHGWLSAADRRIVADALSAVDACYLSNRKVQEMSDGERQRLAVARALAQEASLILLDEPTAFLDFPHRISLMGLLRNLCKTRGVTAVVSLHDLDLAMRFADKLLLLDGKGHYYHGIPEIIALQGAINTVFDSSQVSFDLEQGHFRLQENLAESICCTTEGVLGDWIRKALRRQGYSILPNGYPLVEGFTQEGHYQFQLTRKWGDPVEVFTDLETLLDRLPSGDSL